MTQIKWIEDASGESKRCRAMIVGWQNSLYAINQLIESYNSITLRSDPSDPHQPMRVIAARRQVLASLLELKNKLDQCARQFQKSGFDFASIDTVRKSHRPALQKAESWREIRNLTFHYGDIIEPADELLATYSAISRITNDEVNLVWQAMIEVGGAIKQVALNHA